MNWNFLLAGFVTSIVWFITGAVLYMNPFAKKISDSVAKDASIKKWKQPKDMMIQVYLFGTLIPSIIFAAVYMFVSTVLPVSRFMKIVYFGLILMGIKIIPRMADMGTMTTYPRKLLLMDLVNGSIASFVIATVLSYML